MIGASADIKDFIMFESQPRMVLRNVISVIVRNLEFLISIVIIKFK